MADEFQNPALDAQFQQAFAPPAPTREPAAAIAPEPDTGEVVNVLTPEGEITGLPKSQLADALHSGYQVASDDAVHQHLLQEKYGSTGEQLKTGLEGAASAATFGLSTGIEKAFGAKDEDIQGRREANPVSHMVGQVGGLAASTLVPGLGAANVLERAGAAGVEALGLANAASTTAKIGSAAVKGAIENMAFQGGDEVSKMITHDPNQSAETAITDIGLSGLIGGGISGGLGAVSPLWHSTIGPKVGASLKAFQERVGGVEGALPDAMQHAIDTAGITVPAEVKATLNGNPRAAQMFQTLQESASNSGLKAQQLLKDFHGQAAEGIVEAMGKKVDDIAPVSAYDAGTNMKKNLVSELKKQIDPISEEFDKVRSRFKDLELPKDITVPEAPKGPYPEVGPKLKGEPTTGPVSQPGTISELSDNLSQLAQEKGWNKAPGSPEFKLVNRILEELPLQKTLEDLRNFQSLIGEEASRQQMWHFGSEVKKLFRTAEENVVIKALGETAPELMASHAAARQGYRDAMTVVDSLNDRLHVGKFSGPGSFIKALQEMSPEDIARRISGKGDVDLLNLLHTRFPETAAQVRDFHINNLLDVAGRRATGDSAISTKAFFTNLDKLAPELKNFIVPKDAGARLGAIRQLLDAVPAKMNNSGTAKAIDSLYGRMAGTVLGTATAIAGHNPMVGALIGHFTNLLNRDIPDAVRLSMLRFLGSNQQIDSAGFKSMVDYMQHTIKGENLAASATKNIFKAGREVLPQSQMPSESDRRKLDKQLQSLQTNPEPLMDVGGKTAHYMPDHGQAMGQLAAQAVTYVNGMRPDTNKKSPLDTTPVVNPGQKAAFDRILNIAQQPLVVLDRVKSGTVTPSELVALKTMYPSLYARLSSKVMDNMTDAISKGDTIPYNTRLGLSLFLGQPLDSTMTPQGIISAQPKPPQPQQESATQTEQRPKHSMTALNKLPGSYQTPDQARTARQSKP